MAVVYLVTEDRVEIERVFNPGDAVSIGSAPGASLLVPTWRGSTHLLLDGERFLHLGPGMRLHMCHDEGEDRLEGTYEELLAVGTAFPLHVNVSKLNMKVQEGISVFVKFI